MNKYRKRIIPLLLAVMLCILSFSACRGDTGEGKSLTFPIDKDPVYLDPQIVRDKGGKTIVNNCFEGLVRFDENGKTVPAAAESWDISNDGLTYTFHLRKDTVWLVTKTAAKLYGEDKTEAFTFPLTANDFVFALRRAAEKDTKASDALCLSCIKNFYSVNNGKASSYLGVSAPDSNTLVIELTSPDSELLSSLAKPVCMPCNEEFFKLTGGRYGLSSKYLIYNGPFYISSWQENTSLTVRKNEYYKGVHTAVPLSVYFSVNNEYETRGKKLKQGTYDITPLTYDLYKEVQNEKELTFKLTDNTVWGLLLNCKDEYMKLSETRLAFIRGFDSSLVTPDDEITGKSNGIITAASCVGGESYREKAGKIKIPGYDIKKAERNWDNALTKLNVKGISITIKCPPEYENSMRAVLQNMQKAFGVSCDIRVSVLEVSELLKDIENGSFRAAFCPLTAGTENGADFIGYTASLSGFTDSRLTSGLSQVRRLQNDKKIKKLRELEELLCGSGVFIPVFDSREIFAMGEGVQGAYTDPSGSVFSFFGVYKFD